MKILKKIRVMVEPPSNVSSFRQKRSLDEFVSRFDNSQLIVDIGSGIRKHSSRIIGLDFVEVEGVDICGNLYSLPLRDNCLDGIIIKGVLEHIEFPQRAVAELERVLKPGGLVYSSIPFMQAYHPSPGDFQRFTIDGIQRLFYRFEKIECAITRGAGSSAVWIGREYLSQLFSLNNIHLYKMWKVIFGWLLQPLKYTDHMLNHHHMAHVAASGFTFIGKKSVGALEQTADQASL